MTGIYLVQGNGELVEMTEQAYDSEDLLQALLAKYPAILAGDQMHTTTPRRWLLVSREVAIPGDDSGGNRWSVDHLFVDQDAIPTLVEVKRSSDTRLRREVVGQMLDYAANAVVYWPVAAIRARFEARCQSAGRDPADVLQESFGVVVEGEGFWQNVKTNLQAGRVRLVFVADVIPTELRRIIEFLNGQMDPAEVLGVEIRQYIGGDLKTLVPRVFGQTAEAQVKKSAGGGQSWDKDSFLGAFRSQQLLPALASAVERLLEVSEDTSQDMGWGRGRMGSFSPKFRGASTKSFFTVHVDGDLTVNRKWHDQKDAGESAPRLRDEFVNRLRASGLKIAEAPYPALPLAEWSAKVGAVVDAIEVLFKRARKEGGEQ